MDDTALMRQYSPRLLIVLAAVVFVTVLIPALFILAAGNNPLHAYMVLLSYTLGSWSGFLEVLTQTIPLTLVGLGVAVAFRAGVFNIGGDGQLLTGAIVAFAVSSFLAKLPTPLGLLGFLIAGFIGGGLLGAFVGWLKIRFNASEIISTIVLNVIALQWLSWVVRGPLQEPSRVMPWSDYLPDELLLEPIFDASGLHHGLWVALIAVIVVALLVNRTPFGYKLTVVGQNLRAARYAGLREKRVVVLAMLVSGGLAGLAGSVQIAGVLERLQDDFSPGYGESAIAIALMARLSPAWVPLAAFLFGVLYVGAGVLQRQAAIPFPIVYIVEGIVIFGFLFFHALSKHRN